MSAVIPNPAAGHAGHHDHAHDHPHGWRRWVFATNHKDIGTMYLWFSMAMFFIGGAMALVIRLELVQPGLQFVDPGFFNSMTTMHALLMIFGAVMPYVAFGLLMLGMVMLFPGLATWLPGLLLGR